MGNVAAISLDPGTFIFFLSLFGIFMGAISFSTASSVSSNIKGLKDWGRAMFFLGAGFGLYYLRNWAPNYLTMLVANFIMLGAPVFALIAYCKFFNAPVPKKLMSFAVVLGIIGNIASYYALSKYAFGISFSTAVLFIAVLHIIVKNSDWKKDRTILIGVTAIGLLVTVLLIRTFSVSLGGGSSANIYAKSGSQFVLFIMISFSIVFTALGFILMVHNRQKREVLDSSRRDGLTGLYTRTAFFESAYELDKRYPGEIYSVLMVDIDFFKKINDTYGHAAGDVAIIQLSRLLAKQVRPTDLVGRYGGEEFCILLRDCSVENTEKFAHRLVSVAAEQKINLPNNQEIGFTISVGYTQRKNAVPEKSSCISELLEKADQALYQAKRTGRNQAIGNF